MEVVGTEESVKRKMSYGLFNMTKDVPFQTCKNAVGSLMWTIGDPSSQEIIMLGGEAYVRYITFEKDGCLGFCGKKVARFGPFGSIKSSKRMMALTEPYGGFGGSVSKIKMIGVMYNAKSKRGGLHRILGDKYQCPALFLHKASVWRNQPKRAAQWGYYWPQFGSK